MKPFSIFTLPLVLVTTALADRGRSIVYWGQGTNDTQLSAYCTPQADVDLVVLSFLSALATVRPSHQATLAHALPLQLASLRVLSLLTAKQCLQANMAHVDFLFPPNTRSPPQ